MLRSNPENFFIQLWRKIRERGEAVPGSTATKLIPTLLTSYLRYLVNDKPPFSSSDKEKLIAQIKVLKNLSPDDLNAIIDLINGKNKLAEDALKEVIEKDYDNDIDNFVSTIRNLSSRPDRSGPTLEVEQKFPLAMITRFPEMISTEMISIISVEKEKFKRKICDKDTSFEDYENLLTDIDKSELPLATRTDLKIEVLMCQAAMTSDAEKEIKLWEKAAEMFDYELSLYDVHLESYLLIHRELVALYERVGDIEKQINSMVRLYLFEANNASPQDQVKMLGDIASRYQSIGDLENAILYYQKARNIQQINQKEAEKEKKLDQSPGESTPTSPLRKFSMSKPGSGESEAKNPPAPAPGSAPRGPSPTKKRDD